MAGMNSRFLLTMAIKKVSILRSISAKSHEYEIE